MEGQRRRQVVLVDDNELTLNGFAGILAGHPAIDLRAAMGHAAALSWEGDWSEVDVAVVDAADEDAPDDQLPGVGVVRHIRTAPGDARPCVIVVTGHFWNDGLRHRMALADADFFFERASLRSASVLCDIVLHPEQYRRGVPCVQDAGTSRVLGLTDGADVEALVGYVIDAGLGPNLAAEGAARPNPRGRGWARHRRAMAEASGIEPVNMSTGDRPRAEGQQWPSIRQLGRAYRWAARVTRGDDRFTDAP